MQGIGVYQGSTGRAQKVSFQNVSLVVYMKPGECSNESLTSICYTLHSKLYLHIKIEEISAQRSQLPLFKKMPICCSHAVHSILVRAERSVFDLITMISDPNPNLLRFTGTIRFLSPLKTAEHDVTLAQQRALQARRLQCSDGATITSMATRQAE